MGKRENADKRAKRHKRHKGHKEKEHRTRKAVAEKEHDTADTSQSTITPTIEHEDSMMCEVDVELHASEDIDVGGADDELNNSTASAPDSSVVAAYEEANNTNASVLDTSTTSSSASPKIFKKSSSRRKLEKIKRSPTLSTPAATPKPATASTPSKPTATASSSNATMPATGNANNNKKGKRRRESDTSSDEERWLTAIESGKLEDVDDELKKIKDPKLMTARQRAMYERNLDKEPSPGGELLMSLPTGYREKEKPQTAEDIKKAALKSQKRKQLADEKREKDKKKTMERLLKKQESKQRSAARNKSTKVAEPMISYRNTADGAFIHMPADHEFPLQAQTERLPPKVQLCGIAGCDQPKVYNCSKTNIPLCSFACYRKNVQSIRQIMC